MEWVPKVSLGLITTGHARDLEWNPNSLTMTCKWSDPYPPLTFISEPSSWVSLLRSCPLFFLSYDHSPFLVLQVSVHAVTMAGCFSSSCISRQTSPPLRHLCDHPTKGSSYHSFSFSLVLFSSLLEISIHFIFVSVDWWLGNNLPYWTMAESENDLFHRRGKFNPGRSENSRLRPS